MEIEQVERALRFFRQAGITATIDISYAGYTLRTPILTYPICGDTLKEVFILFLCECLNEAKTREK